MPAVPGQEGYVGVWSPHCGVHSLWQKRATSSKLQAKAKAWGDTMQVYCWLNEGTEWYFKHVARLVLKQHNSCFVVSRNSYGSHGFRKWQCLKFSQLRDVKTLSAIPDSWRLKSSCYRVQKFGSDSITLTMIISHSRKILKYFSLSRWRNVMKSWPSMD